MKVELFQPESVTEPRHWVRHDQAFAMMLRPGSIEWGAKRGVLPRRKLRQSWSSMPHLQLSISDAALMTSSDGAYGEVALRASRPTQLTRVATSLRKPDHAAPNGAAL